MGDFNLTNASWDPSHNTKNITLNAEDKKVTFIMNVVACIIISIGLPLTLVAIYALYSLVRKDQVAPVYIINLLFSDLLQFFGLIVWVANPKDQMIHKTGSFCYDLGLIASVGFMVCVALERYLVVACPLWYHFRRNIKISVVVCVVIWVLPLLFVTTFIVLSNEEVFFTVYSIFLLIPLPLLIFFPVGTVVALSTSRVPSDEKRRIVGLLVLVLLIYTLLFLPYIVCRLAGRYIQSRTFERLVFMFLQLSPLADAFLYVFMRKGTIDKLLTSVFCCRVYNSYNSKMNSNYIDNSNA